jgi:hypothetical protein
VHLSLSLVTICRARSATDPDPDDILEAFRTYSRIPVHQLQGILQANPFHESKRAHETLRGFFIGCIDHETEALLNRASRQAGQKKSAIFADASKTRTKNVREGTGRQRVE